jgi:hypothetical protein
MYVCFDTCMYVWIHVCMDTYMNGKICSQPLHTYIHTYVHTYIHRLPLERFKQIEGEVIEGHTCIHARDIHIYMHTYIADCLTATDITSLKTCLAYYRLVPLVGAVGHVSQGDQMTLSGDHPDKVTFNQKRLIGLL